MDKRVASPLAGKRVVVTRAMEQSAELVQLLSQRSAVVISLPLIAIAEPDDFFLLDEALLQWESFDWILFTSANAVRAVKSRGDSLGQNLGQSTKKVKVAVVGPATKAAADEAGFPVTYVASTHLGVALANELGEHLRGKTVLLPRSNRGNPDLPAALSEFGAEITEVTAYRTVPPGSTDRKEFERVVQGEADAILFFSPTAVQNFAELLGRERMDGLKNHVVFAAVGPVTAGALRDAGVGSIVVAEDTTATEVVAALEKHFSGTQKTNTARANPL